jgi:uncharacterized tellurite resistance protein B-like protein
MAHSDVIMSLAKVIIAAAWAEGEMSNDEINSLKDLLFRLPEMTASDWARLEMYIEEPVDPAERARLVEDLKARMATRSEKEMALDALGEMIQADGMVTESEQEVVREIKASIQDADVGLLPSLSRLVRGPVQRRSEAVAGAPNREIYLEDYLKNRIFYQVRRRLENEDLDIDLPEAKLRKLSLAGGLMAQVAFVDQEIKDQEFDTMVEALQTNWEVSRTEACLVAEVATSEVGKELDFYRLCRQFFEHTSREERLHFLDVLFSVAAGDGQATYQEIEEIRSISKMLKLSHRQFIEAKLKLPRDKRAT